MISSTKFMYQCREPIHFASLKFKHLTSIFVFTVILSVLEIYVYKKKGGKKNSGYFCWEVIDASSYIP